MNTSNKFLSLLFLLSFLINTVYASEYSQIDEKILLNSSSTNSTSDEVIIYSNVRNKTIHLAMNTQFERIENMMFVNTIYELDTEDNSFEQDEDCD